MPPSPKAVLISLADNANDHGECWPSIPTICERTCLSERTVHAAIKWLEQAKIVTADRSNGRHTRYVLTPEKFAEPPQQLHPRSSCTPANTAVTPAAAAVVPPQIPQSPPQQLRSNHQEPSKEPSGTVNKRARKPKPEKEVPFDASAIQLPDWLPRSSWSDWVEHRIAVKAPMTKRAAEMAVRHLERLRTAGNDPVAVIEQSVRSGKWTDLYPLRDQQQRGQGGGARQQRAEDNLQQFLRLTGGNPPDDGRTIDMEAA
jgi:hypothetical protein